MVRCFGPERVPSSHGGTDKYGLGRDLWVSITWGLRYGLKRLRRTPRKGHQAFCQPPCRNRNQCQSAASALLRKSSDFCQKAKPWYVVVYCYSTGRNAGTMFLCVMQLFPETMAIALVLFPLRENGCKLRCCANNEYPCNNAHRCHFRSRRVLMFSKLVARTVIVLVLASPTVTNKPSTGSACIHIVLREVIITTTLLYSS